MGGAYSQFIVLIIVIMILKADTQAPEEEKRMATWGTDVPEGVVLDDKLLAKALKKVNLGSESFDLCNLPRLFSSSCYI